MTQLPLKPKRGGLLKPFGCGPFIRDFLLGKGPWDSLVINSRIGAPQSEIFHEYKMALIRVTALDRATRTEEKRSKKETRAIEPARIEQLTEKLITKMPYKAQGCRLHSFVVYFSMLQKLGWVEATGREEHSAFQDNYPEGQPRKYFRITPKGRKTKVADWANPHKALYGN